MSKSYALLVDPSLYDLTGATGALEHDTWTVSSRKAHPGDRIIFWQTKDHVGKRGIVAFGVVTEEARERTAFPESAPFFRGEIAASDLRLRLVVRYVMPAALPLWLDEDETGTLRGLTVARGRGSHLFTVTDDQWDAIMALIGGWPELGS
jgi:hypothetical protein